MSRPGGHVLQDVDEEDHYGFQGLGVELVAREVFLRTVTCREGEGRVLVSR